MNLFTLSAKLTLDDSVFYSGLKSAEQNAQKVGTRIENALRSGVTNAPTLLVPAGNGYEVYDNVSKIKKFVEDNKI